MRAKYVLSEVATGLWRNVTMTVAMMITMAVEAMGDPSLAPVDEAPAEVAAVSLSKSTIVDADLHRAGALTSGFGWPDLNRS